MQVRGVTAFKELQMYLCTVFFCCLLKNSRALFMSVDPITRLYMSYGMDPGDVLPGRQVARIVESRSKGITKGMVI